MQSEHPQKGLNIVLTGEGKGETSAAMGILMRARGHELKAGVIQFIRGGEWSTGESLLAAHLDIPFESPGDGFTWQKNDQKRSGRIARRAWAEAQRWISSSAFDILILDDITFLFSLGWLDVQECINRVRENKHPSMHLVWTRRCAPAALIDFAGLVTEMKLIKHPLKEKGIPARQGIDF